MRSVATGIMLLTILLIIAAAVGATMGATCAILVPRPPLKSFDSTLGFPGEGPIGDRTQAWDVSIQTARRRIASCKGCNTAFEVNQVRVSPHGTTAGKQFHPHCIAGGLGPVGGLHGYTELPADARQVLDACVDRPGATKEEYLESKRRRLTAPVSHMDTIDLDGAFEDGVLHHMEWWDTINYESARKDWAPTVGSVPEELLLAIADARTAILVPAQTATGVDKQRLLKLLFFMDRLLFAQPDSNGKRLADGKNPKLDKLISERLHRFWRGGWGGLWRCRTERRKQIDP